VVFLAAFLLYELVVGIQSYKDKDKDPKCKGPKLPWEDTQ